MNRKFPEAQKRNQKYRIDRKPSSAIRKTGSLRFCSENREASKITVVDVYRDIRMSTSVSVLNI